QVGPGRSDHGQRLCRAFGKGFRVSKPGARAGSGSTVKARIDHREFPRLESYSSRKVLQSKISSGAQPLPGRAIRTGIPFEETGMNPSKRKFSLCAAALFAAGAIGSAPAQAQGPAPQDPETYKIGARLATG